MPGGDVETTVVVVTWQGAHLLPDCLNSLAAQREPHQVLVVDNASTDGTTELLARDYPGVEVIQLTRNTGFAGGVHAALDHVQTPYLALLNNDAKAEPDWLSASVTVLRSDPDVAAVTARMLLWPDPEGVPTINNAGVVLTPTGYGADRGGGEPDGLRYADAAEVFGFSGGAAVLRTDAVRQVGGMPEEFFLYYEDTDLAWRLRLAGWSIRYEPGAIVRHRHAASTDRESDRFAYFNERNRLLMLLRCAPASFVTGAIVRYLLTTISLLARRCLGQRIPDAAVFRVGLRVHAFAGAVKLVPWGLRGRKQIGKWPGPGRRAIIKTWVRPIRQLS
jgi:GT2 family glycosyltransferase